MPATVHAKFTIKGDVTSAVQAATKFGKAITSLNRRMTALAKKADRIDKFSKKLDKMNRTVTSFTRRANSASKAADRLKTSLSELMNLPTDRLEQLLGAIQPPKPTAPKKAMEDYWTEAADMLSKLGGLGRGELNLSGLVSALAIIKPEMAAIVPLIDEITEHGMKFTTIGAGLKAWQRPLSMIHSLTDKVKSSIGGMINRVQEFIGRIPQAFNTFQRFFMDLSDGLRMITLGITNVGRSLMFFISIPLGAVFYNLSQAVIDFDDQMKRVQKTTGLSNDEMEKFTRGIRDLAMTTPTAHGALGRIAEQIGQLGVWARESILELTKYANLLVVSTDITEDEVGLSLGRIANAFNINLNKSTDAIWRAINVINILENETAATAAEIVEATLQFAPVASLMEMTIADTIAMGSTLVALGYDASKAGTALRNLGIYMVKNLEDVEALMKGYDKYAEKGTFATQVSEDFTSALLDFLWVASQDSDWIKVLTEEMDKFNLRGGRGAASLTKNIQQLVRNLRISREEWENAASILREYDRQLSSTRSQLAILRNNLVELGITVGDTVLPILNKVVQFLIPLVQMATEWFAQLDRKTQLWIVGIAALLVVGGPLIMFFAQIVHGMFLMAMGIGVLLRTIPILVGAFGSLLGVVISFGGVLRSVPPLMVAAIFGILKILQKSGVDIAQFFRDLADRAKTWGENLAATYSSGLISGAILFISRALAYIGNLIASFLAGFSPPKVGPLSTIDKWGREIMREYLLGFLEADFSILQDVSSIIERILSNLEFFGQIGEGDQFRFLMAARVNLAKLIDLFRKTGEISESVLSSIVAHLGDMAGDVADLIRYWFEYLEIQRQLEEIEHRREAVIEGYEDELEAIQLSGKSAEERVALIRQAQREKNQQLQQLDEEQKALEEQEKQARENLSWQQQFIRALTEQDDILRRLEELLERLAKAAEKLSGAVGGVEPFDETFGGIEDAFEIDEEQKRNLEALYNLPQRIEDARSALEGLFAGLRGESPRAFLPDEKLSKRMRDLKQDYMALYNLGSRIRDVWITIRAILDGIFDRRMGEEEYLFRLTPEQRRRYDEITGFFEDIRTLAGQARDEVMKFWRSLTGGAQEVPGEGPYAGPYDTFFGETESAFEKFQKLPIVSFIVNFAEEAGKSFGLLMEAVDNLAESIVNLGSALSNLGEVLSVSPATEWIGGLILKIGELLGLDVTEDRAAIFGRFFGGIANVILSIPARVLDKLANLIDQLARLIELISSLTEINQSMKKGGGLAGLGAAIVTGIVQGMDDSYEDTGKSWLENIWERIVQNFKDFFGISSPSELMRTFGVDLVFGLILGLDDTWPNLLQVLGEKLEDFVGKMDEWKDDFLTKAEELLQNIVDGLLDGEKWGEVFSGIGTNLDDLLADIGGYIDDFFTMGYEIASSFVSGLVSKASSIFNQGIAAFEEFVEDVKDRYGLDSPSKVFKRIGKGVASGFILGINDEWPVVLSNLGQRLIDFLFKMDGQTDAFHSKALDLLAQIRLGLDDVMVWGTILTDTETNLSDFLGRMDNRMGDFKDKAGELLGHIRTGLLNDADWGSMASTLGSQLETLSGYLSKYIEIFARLGQDIAEGFTQGLRKKAEQVASTAKSTFSGWVDKVKTKFKWHSPSGLMEKFGIDTIRGYIKGIEKMSTQLELLNKRTWDFKLDTQAFMPKVAMTGVTAGGGTREVHLHLHDPIIRDEHDIQRLAELVKGKLDEDAAMENRFGGASASW